MAQEIYDLDNIQLPLHLYNKPLTQGGSVSSRFRAIPLRDLGFTFREFSRYGRVMQEGPEKLVMKVKFGDAHVVNEVKRAWVSKYRRLGDQCLLTLGPPVPYKLVEVVLEYVGGAETAAAAPAPAGERKEHQAPTAAAAPAASGRRVRFAIPEASDASPSPSSAPPAPPGGPLQQQKKKNNNKKKESVRSRAERAATCELLGTKTRSRRQGVKEMLEKARALWTSRMARMVSRVRL
ncbi:hypothetical protein AAE478_008319 [Parahypoxylon ruwenzoriense]